MSMRIHPNAFRIIEGMSYKRARKTLKEFGCTKSEQSYIIREYKKLNQMTTNDEEEILKLRNILSEEVVGMNIEIQRK